MTSINECDDLKGDHNGASTSNAEPDNQKEETSHDIMKNAFVAALDRVNTIHNEITVLDADQDKSLTIPPEKAAVYLTNILNGLADVGKIHERILRRDSFCLDHLLRSLRSYIVLARFMGMNPDLEEIRRTMGILTIRGVEFASLAKTEGDRSPSPPSSSSSSSSEFESTPDV